MRTLRFVLINLVVLIAGCSDDKSYSNLSEIINNRCDLTAYSRKQPFVPYIIEEHVVITRDQRYHALTEFQQGSCHYLVIDSDTFRNDNWKKNICRIGEDTIYVGTNNLSPAARENEYQLCISHICENDSSFLFQYAEGHDWYLTIAETRQADLNGDGDKEGIVAIHQGWYNRYYFFAQDSGNWTYHSQLEIPSRGQLWPIDLSLKGYFGLRNVCWGTGMCAIDYDFFRLDPDTSVYIFSISSEFGEDLWSIAGAGYSALMSATGTARMIDQHTVAMDYHSTFELLTRADDKKQFEHHQNVTVLYQQSDPDSAWIPVNPPGGHYNGGDAFYPELEMMNELCRLKSEGNSRQRQYLKDLNCNLEFYR